MEIEVTATARFILTPEQAAEAKRAAKEYGKPVWYALEQEPGIWWTDFAEIADIDVDVRD